MGLEPVQVERVRVAGVLHDIGKLGISDAVLLKPGSLEKHEWEEIMRHPELGARILEHANLRDVANWVLSHHERLDGAGYPAGLTADDLALGPRILAACDVYDALVSDRVYSEAWSTDRALGLLREQAGTAFDPRCVEALAGVVAPSAQAAPAVVGVPAVGAAAIRTA
jgi:putative two-component system response regulator